jgi:hypothetical protein
MKPSNAQLESAYNIYMEYNELTSQFLNEGVEGLTHEQLLSAVFSSLSATLAKLSIACEVSKGDLIDGVGKAYDVHNWDYQGGNDVTRQ